MTDREFSETDRKNLASKDEALPDGSYPMPDCDAVKRAIESYGRAPKAHRLALARLIEKRNNDLGCGYNLEKIKDEADKPERGWRGLRKGRK